MKFILSTELDKNKWDKLVSETNSSFYSKSMYLDIMSKNWGAYTNESYSKGVAVCYNNILSIKKIYPPIFSKTIDFINLSPNEGLNIIDQIKRDFKIGTLYIKEECRKLEGNSIQVFQELKPNELKLNQQAKRMLSKAENSGVTITEITSVKIVDLVLNILRNKITDIDSLTFNKIKLLVLNLEENKELISYGILDKHGIIKGGLIFHKEISRLTYLTGACEEEARKQGGMYLCMFKAISNSIKENKTLNFGGSNIENIRRFYTSFGGKDVIYYKYEWDYSPYWFSIIKKVKTTLKK